MLKIGKANRLKVAKEVDFGLYLLADDEEILLPLKYVPAGTKVGDILDVFIYKDSEDRIIATTLKPKASVGEFAYLKVVDTTPIGAFLDWGLEKDLFVPKSAQEKKMIKGKSYVVRVSLDETTDRIIADGKIERHLQKDTNQLKRSQKVELFAYRKTPLGVLVIVDNRFEGLVYDSDIFCDIGTGDRIDGYIKNIRQDGKLDISLKPQGQASVESDADKVLKTLKAASGSLDYSYKSSPEDIKNMFSMSRKAFKRALTTLIEKNIIEVHEKSIRLK